MSIYYILVFATIIKIYLSCESGNCPIPYINNGNYSTLDKLYLIIKFHCNQNYSLHGLATNRCTCKRWLYPFPVCQRQVKTISECSVPYIQKGSVECLTVGCNRFLVGTEAAFRCERGYQLVGRSRLHCQWRDGFSKSEPDWSFPVPKCVLIDAEYGDSVQEGPSVNIFYSENSSIMVIIIILSVLACGLMLLISAMLMNRLMKRRRLMRFQRHDGLFGGGGGGGIGSDQMPISTEVEAPSDAVASEQNSCSRDANLWSCFTRSNTHYQHMETPPGDGTGNVGIDHEITPTETPEAYNHPMFCNDRESLINPPCYEEAVKCSQYSIVISSNSSGSLNLKAGNKKSKHGNSKSSKRDRGKAQLPVVSGVPCGPEIEGDGAGCTQELSEPRSSLESTESAAQNGGDGCGGPMLNESNADSVSRRSARVHYSRVVNNISAESNASFLSSGSVETMAVSDGTSVTVHTFDSGGSNPSIGSMRPQTGSIGDPVSMRAQNQHSASVSGPRIVTGAGGAHFSDMAGRDAQRYSPPPSYESAMTMAVASAMTRGSRSCRSNTASPSTASHCAVFVDNMACSCDPSLVDDLS